MSKLADLLEYLRRSFGSIHHKGATEKIIQSISMAEKSVVSENHNALEIESDSGCRSWASSGRVKQNRCRLPKIPCAPFASNGYRIPFLDSCPREELLMHTV
jgi:hypothetical protein